MYSHLFPEGEAPVVEKVSIGRIQADSLAEICNSSLVVTMTIPCYSSVVVCIAVGWLNLQCLSIVLHRLLIVAHLQTASFKKAVF